MQATVVAAVGAVVPTILAAQGMTYLAIDVLGVPVAGRRVGDCPDFG